MEKNVLLRPVFRWGNYEIRWIELGLFAAALFLCVYLRILFFEHVSLDYTDFLEEWMTVLKGHGGYGGLSVSLGDYTPPYFYILATLTYLPMDPLHSIKLVSCFFDFLMAAVVMRLVLDYRHNITAAVLSFTAVLLAPTVLLNSAAWAQCDSIYTAFLVLCIYGFVKKKPIFATVFFAIAFCFKLQTVFLAPLLVYMWIRSSMKFRYFLLIPGVYIVSVIPSAIAGRSFWELLTIYIHQSGQYKRMALNAPNFYMYLGNEPAADWMSAAAVIVCGLLVLLTLLYLVMKKFSLTPPVLINISLFFLLLIPFFLPHMHERYFYPADVVAILYAFHRPKRFYIPIMVVFASLFSGFPYLFQTQPIHFSVMIWVMFAALLLTGRDLISQIRENRKDGQKIFRSAV